ncbi:bacteriohemerythrin [Intestinimonas sp.]|uniref:bacteriohemerythrin n=1 Tax=Intestinimonas sp. TaxID=1965293 RepID=UPI00260C83B0|nr:hemerythrin family protein [Intestinimonas sp.]
MKYELTKDLESGNAIIDGEHRELFRAVNTLMDACGKGQGRAALEPAIKFLLDYVNKHFAHEEQLQAKSNYPGMAAHKQFHEKYKSKLREIADKIPAAGPSVADVGALNGHIAVLVSHIKTEDKRLGAFLKG